MKTYSNTFISIGKDRLINLNLLESIKLLSNTIILVFNTGNATLTFSSENEAKEEYERVKKLILNNNS